MKTLVSYLSGVRKELSLVVWPKREQVVKLTTIVFVLSGAIGAYVGGLDFAFTKLLELFIGA